MKKRGVAAVATIAFAVACGQGAGSTSVSTSEATLAGSPTAQARLDAMRARFRQRNTPAPVLGSATATGFEKVDASHFRAVFPANAKLAVTKPASVVFPGRASDPVSLEDDVTHTRVRFALRGASDSLATTSNGMVLYPAALDGADVVQRAHAEGTEDYVVFESKPAVEELSYDVDVSRVAGVRLVGNSVEFLDHEGAPRLRVAPPYAVGQDGMLHDATLALTGCAYDTSPAMPWQRAVTAPGASTCVLHVAWAMSSYPAIVDPGWSTTGSLATARDSHTATLLSSGKVLVVGGLTGVGTNAIQTNEVYDPATGTWSATGSLPFTLVNHTATLLKSGKVLITGGIYNGVFTANAEVWDPAVGTFGTASGIMSSPRIQHTAALLASGKVLIAGGNSGNGYPTTVDLYDPATNNFTATGALPVGRSQHTATVLASGKVLLTAGFNGGGGITNSAVYDPTAGTFSTTGPVVSVRLGHTATLLGSGKVLVTAGGNPTTSAELYDPAGNSFSATGSLAVGRVYATATLLPSGKVFVVGGNSTDLKGEVYDPATGTFTAGNGMLSAARVEHAAALLTSGKLLVVGGATNTGALASTELYDSNDFAAASKCATDTDCNSGFCVDGVCCNSKCEGQCQACDVSGHAGTCSPVSGAPHGSRTACLDGSGPCDATCDGKTIDKCTIPGSETVCGSACSDGIETDSTCNGKGDCIVGSAHSCNNLVCADATTCKPSCSTDTDCAKGFTCQSGACAVPLATTTCVDDHTAQPPSGASQECAPYVCAAGCKTSCTSVSDCTSPNVCDPTGRCVSPASDDSSGGCNTSSRDPGDASWMLLGIVALARRRKRAPRPQRWPSTKS